MARVPPILVDLVGAVRQAARTPGPAAAVVGLLGVATAGLAIAVAVSRAYLDRPLPFPEPDRLVSVIPGPSRERHPNPPSLGPVDWTLAAPIFETTAAWDLDGFTLVGAGPPEYVDGSWVSPGFFELLGIRPALGRSFLTEDYRPGSTAALISDRLWRRRFGADPEVLGTTVRAHSTDRPGEEIELTIVGILPPAPWQLHRFTEVLRPLTGARMFSLARLRPGMTLDDGAGRLTAAVTAQLAGVDPTWRMSLVSTRDEHVHAIRPLLAILVAAGALLVILAHASAGALLLARATGRLRELAVRRALGATSFAVARQLAVEAGWLGLLGLAAGVWLAALGSGVVTGALERLGGVTVPGGIEAVRLDGAVLAIVALASLGAFAVLAGIPLVSLARRSEALAASARATPPAVALRARRVLATVQVAMAMALLVEGAMLLRSAAAMVSTPVGFEARGLLKAHLLLPRTGYPDDGARTRAIDGILERIREAPGVIGAAAVHPHPFRGGAPTAVRCDGCDQGDRPGAMVTTVTPEYFATMGIPIRAGRGFDRGDQPDRSPVAIVSEDLARRLWPDADPVGRRVRLETGPTPGAWLTVVGVAGAVRKSYTDSLVPDLYRPFAQAPRAYTAVMTRVGSDPAAASEPVRAAVAAADPALALSDVEPMTAVLADGRGRTVILAWFVGVVAAMAVAAALFGLGAVVGYLVRLRHREFAVKLALGARPDRIVATALGEARWIVPIGIGIGGTLAAGAGGLTRSYLLGVRPEDPSTYLAVGAVVAAVTLGAIAGPARRAARVDPAIALRAD